MPTPLPSWQVRARQLYRDYGKRPPRPKLRRMTPQAQVKLAALAIALMVGRAPQHAFNAWLNCEEIAHAAQRLAAEVDVHVRPPGTRAVSAAARAAGFKVSRGKVYGCHFVQRRD